VAGAGLASASASHPTVAAANNSGLHEKVLVDPHGFTLYELSPETTHHLLCKTSACLGFWPPLKAPSAKAKLVKGAGVKGKLGTMRRHGFFQVTLDGRPLYRFSVETAKGQSKGQGIHGFGGVWHVVREGAATTTSTQTTTTPMTTTSTSSTYSIPGY
jgi:predicted lipoprotein with Yx(FWY)xxD motif